MKHTYVITIASEKGGVGKTTLATNLAIYLKGLREELPVTLFSLDNHQTVDQLFQLREPAPEKNVGGIFRGISLNSLIVPGQYGVDYIPSSRQLYELQHQVTRIDQLARSINSARPAGVLIIDTSPVLDNYTRNALFAADRVIVPVKDAPSLENCRHLAEFLVSQGHSRTILKILPCLVDTRIHFSGPFRNSYQLLKAYAINRGYRCYEGFIAKSPKVETLATNPEGKIYPIMTHARQTDVHPQMSHLTRQVYLDYLDQRSLRPDDSVTADECRQQTRREEYRRRWETLQPGCLSCGRPLPGDAVWPDAYYLEDELSAYRGFVEKSCLLAMLQRQLADELPGSAAPGSLADLLPSNAAGAYLLLKKSMPEHGQVEIALHRLDPQGESLAGRSFTMAARNPQQHIRGDILDLFQAAERQRGNAPARFLLVGSCGTSAQQILEHKNYMQWLTIVDRVKIDLAAAEQEDNSDWDERT